MILCEAQDLSIKDEALRIIMADSGYLIGRKKEKSLQELVAVSQDHFIYWFTKDYCEKKKKAYKRVKKSKWYGIVKAYLL